MTTLTMASWGLGIILIVMTILCIFRIVLTWYPQIELKQMPYSLIYWPTEPFLWPTRQLIPPLGGVDISPIVWVGIFSLLREMLLGQQGILVMMGSN